MSSKFFMTAAAVLLITLNSFAMVVNGSSTVTIQNDNIKQADSSAKNGALINALYNYFSRQQEDQPGSEMPEITAEYLKFIRSYKIVDRRYSQGTITYTVIADVDKLSLADVAYMIKSRTDNAVYVIDEAHDNYENNAAVANVLKKNSFSTKHQLEFISSVADSALPDLVYEAFQSSKAQYLFDIKAETSFNAGKCSATVNVRIAGKAKEFPAAKTTGEGTGQSAVSCVASAIYNAMDLALYSVREGAIPAPSLDRELTKITLTAANYANFATPKNLMEALKRKTFITTYSIKGFAEKSLDIEAEIFVSPDMLLKKLQGIEKEYGFTASKLEGGNILLDFTAQE
jgi:hypothetical protein